MANQRNLKAFVRYDGSGRVVAGSLVLRKKKPKVGRWEEILTYECCNDVPSTTTTSTSNTTTTTTTYSGTYYNAGLASNGATAVCNNQGAFNLPLIITDGCSPGGVTLASGLYSDYGIPNNSTIYINLNNGNVLQCQTFGSSLMSFGCTSCSGTTSTSTTAALGTLVRISSDNMFDPICSAQTNILVQVTSGTSLSDALTITGDFASLGAYYTPADPGNPMSQPPRFDIAYQVQGVWKNRYFTLTGVGVASGADPMFGLSQELTCN